MPEKLFIHADLGDGTILLAGQLIVDDKAGRFVQRHRTAQMNQERWGQLDRWLRRLPSELLDAELAVAGRDHRLPPAGGAADVDVHAQEGRAHR